MVRRPRLGMQTRRRRTPMSVVVEGRGGVERLLAGTFLDGEVQLQRGQVDGVVPIVGAMILGFVDFSTLFCR